MISLSSIRATILPGWEQITLAAVEIGGRLKGEGKASLMLSGFQTSALRGYQRFSSSGGRGRDKIAYLSATGMKSPTGETQPKLLLEVMQPGGQGSGFPSLRPGIQMHAFC